VCGVDGVTYSNECSLGCTNVEKESDGECGMFLLSILREKMRSLSMLSENVCLEFKNVLESLKNIPPSQTFHRISACRRQKQILKIWG
jgi:hypothetical protein